MKWLIDDSRPWYDQPDDTCDYIQYVLPNNAVVLIGTVPNLRSWTKKSFDSIDGWLNVSERLIPNPASHQQWSPWDISSNPPLETIYSSLRVLDYWIRECGYKKIYFHCIHGGTRSPAIFGFYLKAYYPEDLQRILATKTLVRRSNDSDPLELADSYIRQQKEIELILPAIADHTTEKWSNIEDLVREFHDHLLSHRWQREIKKDLPLILHGWWWRIKYRLADFCGRPFWRSRVWLHKKLRTKKGLAYLKARL